jgi:hypothetical protein
MEYAQHIFDDLYKAANLVLRKANEVSTTQTAAKSDQRKCDTTFLSGAMGQIRDMAANATKYRSMTHIAYGRIQQEMVADLARARQLYEERKAVLNKEHARMAE